MMIIDFHTHIRKDKGTVDNFLRGMDENHIDISVVHPIVPGGTLGLSDNEFVGQLCAEHPDRLMGFACVVPTEPDAANELRAALDQYGLKGLKLHPPIQNFSMADPRIAPCIEVCIEYDIPILIHTGGIYTQGARMALSDSYIIDDLAIRYPTCKFIIAHGNPLTWDPVIVAKKPNVYMDTCGTIIAVPWQNPVAFEWNRRNTPIDSYNMNRTYPGTPKGWFTEQLAAAISPLCGDADYLIDWHGSEFGMAINYVLLKLNGGDYVDQGVEMVRAYGLKYLYGGKPAGALNSYAGSLTDYMLSLGKPAIIAEVGHGMHLEFDQTAQSVQGVFNIPKFIGAYPGKPIVPKTQYFLQDRPLMRPLRGDGFLDDAWNDECGQSRRFAMAIEKDAISRRDVR